MADPRTLSEANLSLTELYRRFGDRVHRIALGMLPQALDAEDVTQEVFLKLATRLRQFDGRSRLSTWIHRVAVNQCLQRIERERLRTGASLEPEAHPGTAPDPADDAERGDEVRRARELLARLPEAHRAVLVLREVDELSYAEIAEALEIPVGTVMSRLARARERLAGIVGAPEREPCQAEQAGSGPDPRN